MRRRIGNYVHQPFAIGIVCCNCAIRRDADVLRVHEQTVAGGSRNEALACDSEQQTAIWPAMQSVCYAGHRKRMHVANEGVQARRARLKSMSSGDPPKLLTTSSTQISLTTLNEGNHPV